MPAVGYIAVMIFKLAGGRPMPASDSCTTSPCTRAMSSVPAASRGTFSVLPLVLIASIDDEVAPGIKASESVAQPTPGAKTDETIITLKPNEGVEYKMTMVRGAVVQYSWTANGGNVNYDLHGSPKGGGKETSYKKGREVASDSGTLTAAYDGSHGWFWRNRSSRDVTITLKTSGAYTEIKRVN